MNVLAKPCFMGAGLFLAYDNIRWFLRREDHANNRPFFYDHCIATTILTSLAAAFHFKHPSHIVAWTLFGFTLIAPTTWFFKVHCMQINANRK